jgi:SAM-dependent methyltransferase
VTVTVAIASCDPASDVATARLSQLQVRLDRWSLAQLEQLGVGAGWTCLQIGAGNGSVAAWLADRVGPAGEVLATDLDTSRIPSAPGLRVQRHKIDADPIPLPSNHERGWDLIHVRLALQHLPRRLQVVAALADVLAPGGWLLMEDFFSRLTPVAAATIVGDQKADDTAIRPALEGTSLDLAWGIDTYQAMRHAGLVEVASHAQSHDTEVDTSTIPLVLLVSTRGRRVVHGREAPSAGSAHRSESRRARSPGWVEPA